MSFTSEVIRLSAYRPLTLNSLVMNLGIAGATQTKAERKQEKKDKCVYMIDGGTGRGWRCSYI